MNFAALTDHELFELLREQDAAAWDWIWQKAVLPEARSLRSADMARKCGITPEEMLSRLYEDMIARERFGLYRDDGGSLIGWLRKYLRGYVLEAVKKRAGREVACEVSDEGEEFPIPVEDPQVLLREKWDLVQDCFGILWKKDPLKAYVHLLKLRMNLSSAEIQGMLGISSAANVDQMFARAVKEMRKAKEENELG